MTRGQRSAGAVSIILVHLKKKASPAGDGGPSQVEGRGPAAGSRNRWRREICIQAAPIPGRALPRALPFALTNERRLPP